MLALILVAKAPLRGYAKTRLVGARGMDADDVAGLAEAFLRDTLRTCERTAGARLIVCFAPSEARDHFRALAPRAELIAQVEGDLGARLEAAFEAAFALGCASAVAIGMDTPHLDPRVLRRAFGELERCACVLGPAADGGYYLIGLRQRRAELLRGIEWGSPRVLAQTLARASELGLTTATLDELFDIDDAAALERLERVIDSSGEPCPHTARALAQLRARRPR